MPSLHCTTCYNFHGLGIVITSDPAVSAALHARLRHFPMDGQGAPDLHFEFWCVAEKGKHLIEKPQGRARPVYDSPLGEVVYIDAEDQFYINYGDRVRVLCDPRQGRVQVSLLQSEVENLWLLSHPLFTLPLIELVKRRGYYSLHAAGLGLNGRGLLLPGTSGAGKSMLALALLRAGFGFLGDDMLFLTRNRAGLRVLAFPDEIDVTEETVSLFPELHQLALPQVPGWPKRQVWAERVSGGDAIWECRPAALVFPRVATTEKSHLKPMDRDEALLELVPNVLLTEARSSQAHLDVLAELVSASACYRLETGRDFDALPRLLREVLA